MKAIRVNEFGRPENMILEEIRDSEPGPGQVVVKVHAVGISVGAPADLCFVAADGIPEAIVSRPKRKLVVKRGKIMEAHSIIIDERRYK